VCGGTGDIAYEALTDRLCGVPGEWRLRRCRQDGALWLDPRPIDADLHRCYPGNYFTHSSPVSREQEPANTGKERLRRSILASRHGYLHLEGRRGLPSSIARALAWIPSLNRWAGHQMGASMLPYRAGGRLLDVGCGNGAYLLRMRSYGWEVAGIEPDEEAARTGASKHGLAIHAGTMADAPFAEGSFDAVTSRHVLEHVAPPLEFVDSLARYLKPGGRLVIVTPNADSLGQRLLGRDFYALDPPRHLVIYTARAIRHLFEQVPSLRIDSIGTPTHIARKIYKQGRIVRREGIFRVQGVRTRPADRLGAALFSTIESAAAMVAPLGEEIELVAEKRG